MKKPTEYPTERYDHDVAGMPVFAATRYFAILLGPESIANAVPADDEHCAIAQGCRTQLQTPYVSVGRHRTDLALPHPLGVTKRGHGDQSKPPTTWAVYRFENPPAARHVIIAADTGALNGVGVVVELKPPRPSNRPEAKRVKNKRFREAKGVVDGRGRRNGNGEDLLTIAGVRNLTGQRRRGGA